MTRPRCHGTGTRRVSRAALSAARRGAPRGPVVRLRPRSPCGSLWRVEKRAARSLGSSLAHSGEPREHAIPKHASCCTARSPLAGARRRGEVPRRDRRAERPRCTTARAGSRCSSSAPATWFRGTGTRARACVPEVLDLHEPRPRGRPAGAGRLHRAPRLLQRQGTRSRRRAGRRALRRTARRSGCSTTRSRG